MPRAQAAFPRSGERSHWSGTECALPTEAAGGTYSLADFPVLISSMSGLAIYHSSRRS